MNLPARPALDLTALATPTRRSDGTLPREARASRRRLVLVLGFELATAIVAIAFLASFVVEHLGEPRLALPGAVLLEVALLFLVGALRQTWLACGRGRGALAARLAEARAARRRSTVAVLLLAPLLWTPLAIVVARSTLGLDLVRTAPLWTMANVCFGLALLALAPWILRRPARAAALTR